MRADVEQVTANQSTIRIRVTQILCDLLGVERVDMSSDFLGIGGTSISAEKFANRLRDEFEIRIQGSDVLLVERLDALPSLIGAAIAERPAS